MDFLQTEQRLIYSSKGNENIYKFFNENYGIDYSEFFVICVVIGFKNKSRIAFNETGREFRSNYIKSNNRATLYTVLLSESREQYTIHDFTNKEKYKDMIKTLEEYAEGGVQILIQKSFRSKYYKGNLDMDYKYYLKDLLQYFSDQIQY